MPRKAGSATCMLFAWGEYHAKNTKREDTSAASAHRGWIRTLETDPSAGTAADGSLLGEKAAKYFTSDTTSAKDLRRS